MHLGEELERAAAEEPDRLALSDANENLTYGEMLAEARALAASLPGGGNDRRPVAMLMPSNARTVVAQIAAIIAGQPYCVLNPAQPRRRLEALLAAIEPSVVWVADPDQRSKLDTVGLPATAPAAAGAANGKRRPPPRGDNPICGIYVTSGSSGSPKLVAYRHAATYHRVHQYFAGLPAGGSRDLGSEHRFAVASSPWTAAAASATFACLFMKAELHLFDPGVTKLAVLSERVRKAAPTVWHSSPSAFRRLGGSGALDANRIRVVRLTGEPMLPSDVELAGRILSGEAWLISAYGLTETNGIATQRGVSLGDPEAIARPIDAGYPLDGVEVSIEDEDGASLPAGAEGEIVIGGPFVSGGYLDAERPRAGTRFSHRGERLVVRTGDRGMLQGDGSLVVKGRGDRRVNIRGHRVDPSEVEAEALRLDGVLDAAVVPFAAREDSIALALFATVDEAEPVASQALRAHLRQRLQPEAVPALVDVLNALPQTPAGKADRLRLATLAEEGARGHPAARREEPLVAHLASLWSDALEIDPPGADEDFFALGGDSLAAVEVCAAIEDVYGVALEPAALLDYRSPRALAEHVQGILDGNSRLPSKVLRLNPAGERPPLFVFHGAGSDATALVHFAEAIGPEQPVNVIQLPGANGRGRALATMDAIAAYGISAIEETGAMPPYRIAGTSFGGLAAFHATTELARKGREIAYLGLFDTPAPTTRTGHYLVRPFAHLWTPTLGPRAFARGRRRWLRQAGRAWSRFFADYRMVLRVLLGSERSAPEHRFRHLRIGCQIAADRWTPRALPMPIHLYRCDSQPDYLADSPRLGWEDLAPELEVRALGSRHNRHIRPPNVSELGALVSEDLERAV